VGIPAFQMYALVHNRNYLFEDTTLDMKRHRSVIKKYGGIYRNYVEECYYYDLIDLTRRLLLTGALILLGQYGIAQIFLGALISLGWLVLVAYKRPYKAYWDNVISIALSFNLMVTILCGMTLQFWTYSKDDSSNEYEQVIFDYLLCTFTIGSFVMSVFILFLSFSCIRKKINCCCREPKHSHADTTLKWVTNREYLFDQFENEVDLQYCLTQMTTVLHQQIELFDNSFQLPNDEFRQQLLKNIIFILKYVNEEKRTALLLEIESGILEEIALLYKDPINEKSDEQEKQLINANKGMKQNKKMKAVLMLENVFQKINTKKRKKSNTKHIIHPLSFSGATNVKMQQNRVVQKLKYKLQRQRILEIMRKKNAWKPKTLTQLSIAKRFGKNWKKKTRRKLYKQKLLPINAGTNFTNNKKNTSNPRKGNMIVSKDKSPTKIYPSKKSTPHPLGEYVRKQPGDEHRLLRRFAAFLF
jgi:hypothetical protein